MKPDTESAPDNLVGERLTTTEERRTICEQDDAALVDLSKSGHTDAFEILVARHRRRTFAVAFRFTRTREDAEDVAQQSFYKAFVNLGGFEGKSSFSTWLTRITINEALQYPRKQRTLREISIADLADDGSIATCQISDLWSGPEMIYARREQKRMLAKAILDLTPGVRKAIELRVLQELSTRETADAMGLSLPAVKARIFHGQKRLRKTLTRLAGLGSPRNSTNKDDPIGRLTS